MIYKIGNLVRHNNVPGANSQWIIFLIRKGLVYILDEAEFCNMGIEEKTIKESFTIVDRGKEK